MAGKILFFDIDGTIWNRKNEIPESTREAIRLLRQNGHRTFLNSGRGRAYIQDPQLLGLGFDGIVSGCGTMIEYQGETVFYYKMERQLAEETLRIMRKYGFRPILEGREYLYMDDADFAEDAYGKKLLRELGERRRTIEEHWGSWDFSKFSCATESPDQEVCFALLAEHYDFMIHNPFVAEIVPKGYNKGTGIRTVCELLGTDIQDTIVFGDSTNDLGMFQAAGYAVAMGNGSADAKAAADYVTAELEEDGIWKACRYLNLI